MSINSKLDLLENQVDKLIEITKASKDLIEGISAPNINKIYSTNDTFQANLNTEKYARLKLALIALGGF